MQIKCKLSLYSYMYSFFGQVCFLGPFWGNLFVFWHARSISYSFWSIWNGPRVWGQPTKTEETTWRCWLCFCWIWRQQTQLAGCSCLQGKLYIIFLFCLYCSRETQKYCSSLHWGFLGICCVMLTLCISKREKVKENGLLDWINI